MTLRDKTINGVIWNAISNFSVKGVDFVVGIILARLLTPQEFGLIGTITIFLVLSEVFINSGFNQALIRKQNCTQKDYSTAFYFNFSVAIILFVVLFVSAGPISKYFNEPQLKSLVQVLGIGLIISSLTLVQQSILVKRIDFKLQTKINFISSIISGVIAIIMAFKGFGIWSLVVRNLLNRGLISFFLWLWNKWKPGRVFSKKSFNELFGFGSKLLISGLIGTLLNNLNYLIIAKYFSTRELGYFTRAEMFKKLPSESVSSIITTVAYPVLAKVQDDKILLKQYFRKMFVNTFFIIAILMFGMAAISETLILTLIGNQWYPSIILLQLLCFSGLMYPLNSMNVNILNVVGRSDLYLKLQLIVQLLVIPNLFIGIFFGIETLIIGMNLISIISYVIFNRESTKFINYTLKEQINDIMPTLIIALVMGVLVYLINEFSIFSNFATLCIQIVFGILFVIISGELFSIKEYRFIKGVLLEKLDIFQIKKL